MYSNFKFRAEEELLLYCISARIDEEREIIIKHLAKYELNWAYLYKIASKHGLKPLLYSQLCGICSDQIPHEFMGNLKEFNDNNANKNLFFMRELIDVFKSLRWQGIESVPYKGPILAVQIYENLTMRQFSDIDLFVKKENVPIIKEILISKRYKPKFELDPVQEQNYIRSQRELKFFNEAKSITLELHWKFSGVFLNLPSNAEKIFLNNLKMIEIGGISIPKISPENLILILSIHNASHQWSRLAWLVDIANLVKNQKIDWTEVLKSSEMLGIQKILFINLYLCHCLLNLKLENDISHHFDDNSIIKISNSFAKNYFSDKLENNLIENIIINFNIREKKTDGIKDCFSGIFNPSFYELNHLELPSNLFFLYYLYRPLNLLKRYKFK